MRFQKQRIPRKSILNRKLVHRINSGYFNFQHFLTRRFKCIIEALVPIPIFLIQFSPQLSYSQCIFPFNTSSAIQFSSRESEREKNNPQTEHICMHRSNECSFNLLTRKQCILRNSAYQFDFTHVHFQQSGLLGTDTDIGISMCLECGVSEMNGGNGSCFAVIDILNGCAMTKMDRILQCIEIHGIPRHIHLTHFTRVEITKYKGLSAFFSPF